MSQPAMIDDASSEPAPTPGANVGVADYYNRAQQKSPSRLIELVPDVLILSRCEGMPSTAAYFTERLGIPVSVKMLKTIKLKVRHGKLLVSREELVAAAQSHSTSAARLLREPSLADPQHYRAAIVPEPESETAPPAKKAGRKTAKKAAANKPAKTPAAQPEAGGGTVTPPPAHPPKEPSKPPTPPCPTTGSQHTDEKLAEMKALLDADDEEDAKLYS